MQLALQAQCTRGRALYPVCSCFYPEGTSDSKRSFLITYHLSCLCKGSFILTLNVNHCWAFLFHFPLHCFFFQNWTHGSKYIETFSLKYEKMSLLLWLNL